MYKWVSGNTVEEENQIEDSLSAIEKENWDGPEDLLTKLRDDATKVYI